MARVGPRVAAAVLVGTLLASAAAGYAWSRLNDTEADDSARVSEPGVYEEPGAIATAPALAGAFLPDLELRTLSDEALDTAELLGRPLVMNFWFSTCEPCEKELPDFAAVHAELGDTVRFVGVNHFDPAGTAERFARDRGVRYELLLDPTAALVTELELANFPATLFVTADGRIAELHLGALDAAELRATIQEVLAP